MVWFEIFLAVDFILILISNPFKTDCTQTDRTPLTPSLFGFYTTELSYFKDLIR